MSRVLVACVGNVLRRDDGFGPAVASRLGQLPDGAELIETGIGGMPLLQELMTGFDGLVIVDAVERGAAPGTVFVLEPSIEQGVPVPDLHLASPDRVLAMAKGMGCLPHRVLVVGCQPADTEELGQVLSPAVARAVDSAVARVHSIVREWLEEPERAPV